LKAVTVKNRKIFLEEETIIVRNSGEIPEIALHSSLFFLTEDKEGPHLTLQKNELKVLYDAADSRYKEIVLRDLDPDNRDLTIYRGLARTIANWSRYQDFCRRIDRDCSEFKSTVRQKLFHFLICEYNDVMAGNRPSSVNCSRNDLLKFLEQMELDSSSLPDGWLDLSQD